VTPPKKEKDTVKTSRGKKTAKSRSLPGKTRRFFMNAGRLDHIVKGTVIRNVCDRSGISADKIGKVEILREFSFFEVVSASAERVLKAMRDTKIDGREVRIQYAEEGARKEIRTKKRKSTQRI
jgi:ATP-dependent RNA helicase DeaD